MGSGAEGNLNVEGKKIFPLFCRALSILLCDSLVQWMQSISTVRNPYPQHSRLFCFQLFPTLHYIVIMTDNGFHKMQKNLDKVQNAKNVRKNINKKAVLSQRWPRDARYISGSNAPLRRYGHSKLSKMAAFRQLVFDVSHVTGNSAIRSADPENPTLKPNMKCIGSPVAKIWPFAYLGHMEPHFGGRGGCRGSAIAPFERAMVVSYRLSIVTVTIRPQFAIWLAFL